MKDKDWILTNKHIYRMDKDLKKLLKLYKRVNNLGDGTYPQMIYISKVIEDLEKILTNKHTVRMDKDIKEHFEQNMLDGDTLNDCVGTMLEAKEVYEYIKEFYDLKE